MIKDVLEKNDKATPNGADLEVLKKHFRMCFNSDGSLDLEKLKARLGDQVAISNEGYELKFLGKNYARLLTSLETTTVVVPDKKHNAKPENAKSKNVYISGDNLDALKHLLKSKQGQVKCALRQLKSAPGEEWGVGEAFSFRQMPDTGMTVAS